jgi:Zn finger protein HypA/HybF involved in hydrogenase expression
MTKFNCEHCDKTYGRKDTLKTHINTVHLKQKNYKCDHCDKTFGEKGNLNVHINTIHLKQQNFKCEHCDKTFGRKGDLNIHINTIHLKQKNYKCDHCNESFGQNSHLKIHINRIHINPKPKNMSRGEQTVYDILEELGLEYETDFKTEYKFKNLLGIGNRQLRYDFVIFDKEELLLIEFDGRQHYKPVRWQKDDSDEKVKQRYEMTRCHDKRKNKFAKKHEYPLLRIKYSDVNNAKELIEEFLKDHSTILD